MSVVIDYYEIKPSDTRGVDIVDTRNGERWHFAGGYGDFGRHITQPGCARLVEALGDSHRTDLSIMGALDAIEKGEPIGQENNLRLQLAAAHEAIGAALALVRQQQYDAAQIVLDDALKGKRP